MFGCAPPRPPVPPGVVPSPRAMTTEDEQYGHEVLTALSEQFEIEYNDSRLDNIVDIVDRLAKRNNLGNDPWHVFLFRAPTIKNAGATRGNHVFVWSGMLDEVKSDDELAAVLAHEIAHVIAGHTDPDPNEEIRKLLLGVGAMALGIAVSHSAGSVQAGQLAQDMTQMLGSGVLVNPYSQERELEADQIGLLLMASAGFRPEAALDFWQRSAQSPGLSENIPFLSTHPPAGKRLAGLQQAMPIAVARAQNKTAAPNSNMIASGHSSGTSSGTSVKSLVSTDTWRVVSKVAIVYASPDSTSKALGELKSGALIHVTGRSRQWLQVSLPESGFVNGTNCEPVLP